MDRSLFIGGGGRGTLSFKEVWLKICDPPQNCKPPQANRSPKKYEPPLWWCFLVLRKLVIVCDSLYVCRIFVSRLLLVLF